MLVKVFTLLIYSYHGMRDTECYLATKTADGIDLGIVPFESALINGRGLFHNIYIKIIYILVLLKWGSQTR